MRFFIDYLKARARPILTFVLFSAFFCFSFVLYRLPIEAVIYPTFICALMGTAILLYDARKAYRKHIRLREMLELTSELLRDFPPPVTQDDEDYQAIIRMLREKQRSLSNQTDRRFSEMIDYYTIWAHQIKTPIASMRLQLQNDDSEAAKPLLEELFRIEQYVEMVLCYLRLDSSSTDYVFRTVNLDDVIKQALKKYAGMFIRKKISLRYNPTGVTVITDEKWLLFVIEQVLSNALKYTDSGGIITLTAENGNVFCIRDTGIGISPEDLPRIFEKGYTGKTGRMDMKASGIGLYLCRRICSNLGHTIRAESKPDEGTVIRIYLDQNHPEIE